MKAYKASSPRLQTDQIRHCWLIQLAGPQGFLKARVTKWLLQVSVRSKIENELSTEEKPSVMFFSSPFPAKFSLQIPDSDETATAVPSVLISLAAAVARFHLVGVGTAGWQDGWAKYQSWNLPSNINRKGRQLTIDCIFLRCRKILFTVKCLL